MLNSTGHKTSESVLFWNLTMFLDNRKCLELQNMSIVKLRSCEKDCFLSAMESCLD